MRGRWIVAGLVLSCASQDGVEKFTPDWRLAHAVAKVTKQQFFKK